MGKKRIVLVGETIKHEIKKPKIEEPKVVKSGKQHGRIADLGAEALAEAAVVKEKLEKEIPVAAPAKKSKKSPKPAKKRGARYSEAYKKVDRTRFYPLPEAIKLLKSISIGKFNASVDAHLVVLEAGLRGEIVFPHPTGKNPVIKIADDKLIAELEKSLPAGRQGKINFSVLLSTPAMMPKLLKFAKILGPKGLMPNPKTGTITDKPEETAKSLANKTLFRTETKFPLIHIVIGKINDKEEYLTSNFKALITAVGAKNIKKAIIVPTMGPGIKIDIDKI